MNVIIMVSFPIQRPLLALAQKVPGLWIVIWCVDCPLDQRIVEAGLPASKRRLSTPHIRVSVPRLTTGGASTVIVI